MKTIIQNSVLRLLLLAMISSTSLVSCLREDLCTDEFVMVMIDVKNGTLADFYTIRDNSGEIIRYEFTEGTLHPVLTDREISWMKGKVEDFTFVGINRNGLKVVEERFVIGANSCHIYKEFGRESVDI